MGRPLALGVRLRPRRLWPRRGARIRPPFTVKLRRGCLMKRGSGCPGRRDGFWKAALELPTVGPGRLGPWLLSAPPSVHELSGMGLRPPAEWQPCCCASVIWSRSLGCGLMGRVRYHLLQSTAFGRLALRLARGRGPALRGLRGCECWSVRRLRPRWLIWRALNTKRLRPSSVEIGLRPGIPLWKRISESEDDGCTVGSASRRLLPRRPW